ncbi:MAG: histidine kinase [Alphaproteobacteria bacterium HGW-Alphaproteobacteria-13]|nr:MAG: histidine kinase [Alphaproteobacteria bacterium HGW-Alphaproteobacteria-13]
MAERPSGRIGAATTEGTHLSDDEAGDGARREARRLETLREYRLMDTAREPAFDRVTRLVADLFGAPIALIALIDGGREWLKSAHGYDAGEIRPDTCFCRPVMIDERAVFVPDTLDDARWRDSALVTEEPFARFFAGVPLRAYNGAVLGTLCVMDRKPRPDLTEQDLTRLDDFAAIIMAEADLRRIGVERDEARRMLEHALDFSGTAIWQFDPRTDEIGWRGAVAQTFGADFETELTRLDGLVARIPTEDGETVRAAFRESVGGGASFAVEHRYMHPERGVRWISSRGDWDVWADDAKLTGVSIDITEQKSRQEHANLLMRELHHRMRNLFATVSAIISLTRHAARDVDDYVERIGSRLDALNRAQNVLLGANFMTGSMHALMREVQASFPRVRWSGPDLLLPENALVAMALLLNELATNAVKHGALTGDEGRVDIEWTQDAEGADPRQFRLRWTESGGSGDIVAPDRTSFGTLLMERSVRNNLGGTIERHWDPAGLVVDIALPARWREA